MQQDVDSEQYHDEEIAKWLQLSSIPNFGVASLNKLKRKLMCQATDILSMRPNDLHEIGFKPQQIDAIQQADEPSIQRTLSWLHSDPRHFILFFEHALYPALLTEISSPPMLLFGIGDAKKLANLQIAMVGSRNPSIAGKANAKAFAEGLSLSGWTVTSGLALGIDGFSHEGALAAKGITIAVLGTGIDTVYPKRHLRLAENIIAAGGVILSEFPPATPAKPENFPRRNRIISGLSLGTLVVEAALKSGSLITARYAVEQNRDVFAIPGNINNPLSKGCHYLIQQGAKLVADVADINEEFAEREFNKNNTSEIKSQKNCTESLATDRLLDSVDFEATPLDMVVERSGMPASEVMSQLLEYELRGLVVAVSGGYIKLGEK
ncbi:DNA-processing protein DprA [Flavobacterium sp. W21_SRS_FM6]|uniref:DNA-processing protein DprA n=1 Tax=Flavobacterium sp. W21_SRS_FM6 TaxID=3240268 RepID=UPI003F921223